MKRLAWFTLIVLATLTAAMLFWEFRVAAILFILSLAVAAAVRPLVDRFAGYGLPRGLALLLSYVLCIGGFIVLMLILSGPLLVNLEQLTKDLAAGYDQLRAQWPYGTSLQRTLVQQLPSTSELSNRRMVHRCCVYLRNACGLVSSAARTGGISVTSLTLNLEGLRIRYKHALVDIVTGGACTLVLLLPHASHAGCR